MKKLKGWTAERKIDKLLNVFKKKKYMPDKEANSLEEFVKLVFYEFGLCDEDIENLEKLK